MNKNIKIYVLVQKLLKLINMKTKQKTSTLLTIIGLILIIIALLISDGLTTTFYVAFVPGVLFLIASIAVDLMNNKQ